VDCRPIHAAEALEAGQFECMKAERKTMWGLPVEIVLARKRCVGDPLQRDGSPLSQVQE
jgi:hypothetical protein